MCEHSNQPTQTNNALFACLAESCVDHEIEFIYTTFLRFVVESLPESELKSLLLYVRNRFLAEQDDTPADNNYSKVLSQQLIADLRYSVESGIRLDEVFEKLLAELTQFNETVLLSPSCFECLKKEIEKIRKLS